MSTRVPFQWDNANFSWESNPFPNQSSNPFTWDDVALIEGLVGAIQGGTAYVPTAVQIGGQAQTVNWQGGTQPAGSANKKCQ